jgi:hypothetical protein
MDNSGAGINGQRLRFGRATVPTTARTRQGRLKAPPARLTQPQAHEARCAGSARRVAPCRAVGAWARRTAGRWGGGPTTSPWSTAKPPRLPVRRSNARIPRGRSGPDARATRWAHRRRRPTQISFRLGSFEIAKLQKSSTKLKISQSKVVEEL